MSTLFSCHPARLQNHPTAGALFTPSPEKEQARHIAYVSLKENRIGSRSLLSQLPRAMNPFPSADIPLYILLKIFDRTSSAIPPRQLFIDAILFDCTRTWIKNGEIRGTTLDALNNHPRMPCEEHRYKLRLAKSRDMSVPFITAATTAMPQALPAREYLNRRRQLSDGAFPTNRKVRRIADESDEVSSVCLAQSRAPFEMRRSWKQSGESEHLPEERRGRAGWYVSLRQLSHLLPLSGCSDTAS